MAATKSCTNANVAGDGCVGSGGAVPSQRENSTFTYDKDNDDDIDDDREEVGRGEAGVDEDDEEEEEEEEDEEEEEGRWLGRCITRTWCLASRRSNRRSASSGTFVASTPWSLETSWAVSAPAPKREKEPASPLPPLPPLPPPLLMLSPVLPAVAVTMAA